MIDPHHHYFFTYRQMAITPEAELLERFRASPEWQIEDRECDNGVWVNEARDMAWKVGTSHTANGDLLQ